LKQLLQSVDLEVPLRQELLEPSHLPLQIPEPTSLSYSHAPKAPPPVVKGRLRNPVPTAQLLDRAATRIRLGQRVEIELDSRPGRRFPGEIAFIASVKRSADVVALADSEILVVSQAFLKKLMKSSPELASKVLFNLSRVLCERLVFSTRSMLPEPAATKSVKSKAKKKART